MTKQVSTAEMHKDTIEHGGTVAALVKYLKVQADLIEYDTRNGNIFYYKNKQYRVLTEMHKGNIEFNEKNDYFGDNAKNPEKMLSTYTLVSDFEMRNPVLGIDDKFYIYSKEVSK